MLFGEANTATENNINKLVTRFNAPILEKKLVVCEELYLPPGSDKANAIKTFITEKETVAEHKYQSAQQVEQVCSFIFITNHKPIWLEEGDRRFYVIEVKHDGHRLGPRGSEYAQEVGELINSLADPNQLAALYQALIKHPVPESFDPHSLDILEHSTNIMTELRESSFDINRVSVEEYLNREYYKEYKAYVCNEDYMGSFEENYRYTMHYKKLYTKKGKKPSVHHENIYKYHSKRFDFIQKMRFA